MSNRAQRRRAARPQGNSGGSGNPEKIAQAFTQIGQRLSESFAERQAQQGQDENGGSEDLNMLSKPDTQTIETNYLQWDWIVDGGFVVVAKLYTKRNTEREVGAYTIDLAFDRGMRDDETMNVRTLSSHESKELGQALLAAYRWRDIWRNHAGDFLWESLADEEEEEDVPEAPTIRQGKICRCPETGWSLECELPHHRQAAVELAQQRQAAIEKTKPVKFAPSEPFMEPAQSVSTESEFLGGFGDSEMPPAAPTEREAGKWVGGPSDQPRIQTGLPKDGIDDDDDW